MCFFPVIRLQGGQQGFHRLTTLAGETLQQIPIPLPVVHQALQGGFGVEPSARSCGSKAVAGDAREAVSLLLTSRLKEVAQRCRAAYSLSGSMGLAM